MPVIIRKDFPDFDNAADGLEDFFSKLPRIAGNMALNFFDDSWERRGFIDKSLNRWDAVYTKEGEKKQRPLVGTGRLRRSLRMRTSGNRVTIFTDVPYAQIHNEGGVISGTFGVREHSRKIPSGKTTTVKAHNRTVRIRIPKRQFMGHSDLLEKRLVTQVTNALDKYFS